MVEKYIIDKSDIHDLLKGEELPLTQGRARAFQVEVAGHMTNGELIKALFPNAKTEHQGSGLLRFIVEGWSFPIAEEWWNESYGKNKRCGDEI